MAFGNQNGIPVQYGQNNPSWNQGWNGPQNYSHPTPTYQQIPGISGRMVQNPNEVRPNEVPMDGSCSFFPVMDGSAIYVKCWSQDGSSIITSKFIPENQNGNNPKTPEQLIMERLDNLEALIKNQSRPYYKKGGNHNERNDAGNGEQNDRQQSEHREQSQK